MKKWCEALFPWTFPARKIVRPAKSKISAVQRLILPTIVKWSLHRGSNDVLNKDHDMEGARKEESCFLTKSQRNFLSFSPRPWQTTIWCWNSVKMINKELHLMVRSTLPVNFFGLEKSTGRRTIRSRTFNDSSYLQQWNGAFTKGQNAF